MTERIKLNEDERYGYFVRTRHRKKLLVVIVSLVLIMSLLTVRVGYIMTVRAEYYSVRATELHERERAIKAMRGRFLILMELSLLTIRLCVQYPLFTAR